MMLSEVMVKFDRRINTGAEEGVGGWGAVLTGMREGCW